MTTVINKYTLHETVCTLEWGKFKPGGPQKNLMVLGVRGRIYFWGASREHKTISAFDFGKNRVSCSESTNVVWQVGWNGDGGLGIEDRLCSSPEHKRLQCANETT